MTDTTTPARLDPALAQPGILAPVPPHGRYLWFSLADVSDLRRALQALAERVDGESEVVGLGAPLVRALGATVPGLRDAPSYRSGLAQVRLRDLHDLCDLLWVDGIGPKVARVLTTAGVKNLAALARQEAVTLADLIKETNRKVEILGKLPDPDTTRSWIEQAKARIKAGARPIAPSHP